MSQEQAVASRIGDNIKAIVSGKNIALEIDLTKSLGMSGSGSTVLVASSRGNPLIPGTEATYLNLNLYHKPGSQPTPTDLEATMLGNGITAAVKNKVLTLTIDTSKVYGKTEKGFDRLATTGGKAGVPDQNLTLQLVVYRK